MVEVEEEWVEEEVEGQRALVQEPEDDPLLVQTMAEVGEEGA